MGSVVIPKSTHRLQHTVQRIWRLLGSFIEASKLPVHKRAQNGAASWGWSFRFSDRVVYCPLATVYPSLATLHHPVSTVPHCTVHSSLSAVNCALSTVHPSLSTVPHCTVHSSLSIVHCPLQSPLTIVHSLPSLATVHCPLSIVDS